MDSLNIAGKAYASRLLVGTGKYKDFDETRARRSRRAARRSSPSRSAAPTSARTPNEPSLLDALPPSQYTYLPNTAGCYTADDAVRTLRLARELLDGHDLVKLEVLGDPKTLYPNMVETLKAAETLVKDGFKVMVYCSDDPIIAKQLEEIGCVAVMPLASLIGSGMGILNPWNLQLIIDNAKVPVIVDAGVGTASDAAIAMELGCDGVLMNTAIAGGEESGADGAGDEKGGRGRARGLSRRAHAEEAVRGRAELAHRRHHRQGRLKRRPALCRQRARASDARIVPSADPQLRAAPGARVQRAAARGRYAVAASTASPTRRARSTSSRCSAAARRRSSRSASAWARPPRRSRRRIRRTTTSASRCTRRAWAACSSTSPKIGLTNVRIIQHDAVEVLEHMIAPAVARRRAHLLSRSLAEEAPPQAPPDPAGVRRAARLAPRAGRLPARRHRLGGVRGADARGVRGRTRAREHRARIRAAPGLPRR